MRVKLGGSKNILAPAGARIRWNLHLARCAAMAKWSVVHDRCVPRCKGRAVESRRFERWLL